MKKSSILVLALLLPSLASAATLSVSPSSQSVKVGDTFSVTVHLDTQDSDVDGVDLRYINYNPALLQIQDADASVAGVQISPGSLMPATLANTVESTPGRITFSQVVAGGTKYKGSGTLATISLKALKAGTANLTFGYTPNSTLDSNVAAAGSDILNAVINGAYTITGTGSDLVGSGYSVPTVPQFQPGTPCIPSVTTPTLPALPTFTPPLVFGNRGAAVSTLQTFLVSQGYLATQYVTGYYGPLTQAAVAKYTIARTASGSTKTCPPAQVGTSTAVTFTRSLAPGSTGSDVKALQVFLNAKGFTVNVTGVGSPGQESTYFGPATQRALIRYQIAKKIIPATGFFGPSTKVVVSNDK